MNGGDSYGGCPLVFAGISSAGSSYSALTSGEDNEEA